MSEKSLKVKAPAKKNFFKSVSERIKATAKGIKKFFTDTKSEMKKVVWPSKKQIINNTIIVIVVVFIVGIFIFGIDTAFSFIIKYVLQSK